LDSIVVTARCQISDDSKENDLWDNLKLGPHHNDDDNAEIIDIYSRFVTILEQLVGTLVGRWKEIGRFED
jgi:hypothetical protein